MNEANMRYLACLPCSAGKPHVASIKTVCYACQEPLWRALSSPRDKDIRPVCPSCLEAFHKPVALEPPTEAQIKDIKTRLNDPAGN